MRRWSMMLRCEATSAQRDCVRASQSRSEDTSECRGWRDAIDRFVAKFVPEILAALRGAWLKNVLAS